MGKKVIAGTLVMALAVSAGGCSGWSRGAKGAAIGGIGGAGLGALIGSAAGSWGWGAVIGAGAGIVAGYIIAESTAPSEAPGSAPPPTMSDADRRRQEADNYFAQARTARTASESEYYLKKSIELHPTAAAYNNLGLVYLQSGDKGRAEDAWRKALAIEPGYAPAVDNLARMRT